MAKKRSTQVINWLSDAIGNKPDDALVSFTVAEIKAKIKTLKAIDARDEQGQVKRKKAKKAAR